MKHALTIAGSDSGGGAGIQADLKTFAAMGVYGMSVITAITAQNSCGVMAVENVSRQMIGAQLDAIYSDIPVDSVKIGMLSDGDIVEEVAWGLCRYNVEHAVLDPVMVAKGGRVLLEEAAVSFLKEKLIPLSLVVTPNLPEAEVLTGLEVKDQASMLRAAKAIYKMGARYVIVKGGHLEGAAGDLFYDGTAAEVFSQERVAQKHTHGTGCTFSSAIAAGLAKGLSVREAVRQAKVYITMAIRQGFPLGAGIGPVHHFFSWYPNGKK